MEISNATAKRIKQLCEKNGLSINQLAKSSNLTQSTINEILQGRSKYPRVITIKKICIGLGISLSEFFNDSIFDDIDVD